MNEHFERKLTAPKGPGVLFGGGHQGAPDATSAKMREDADVVKIKQRAGGKGGETDEGVEEAGRGAVDIGEPGTGVGHRGEGRDEAGAGLRREGVVAAHGVARVGVEQVDEVGSVARVVVVCADDGEGHSRVVLGPGEGFSRAAWAESFWAAGVESKVAALAGTFVDGGSYAFTVPLAAVDLGNGVGWTRRPSVPVTTSRSARALKRC